MIAGQRESWINSAEVETIRMADNQQPVRGQQAIENRHDLNAGGRIQIDQQVTAKEHIKHGLSGEQAGIEDASLEKTDVARSEGSISNPSGCLRK